MAVDRHVQARPRNWLVPMALVTLQEENAYGYELMERVREFGFEQINPGNLYRTLRRMENEGLCRSAWETQKGAPARRVYSITAYGESYLKLWAEGLKRYQEVMESFFGAYVGRADRASSEGGASSGSDEGS